MHRCDLIWRTFRIGLLKLEQSNKKQTNLLHLKVALCIPPLPLCLSEVLMHTSLIWEPLSLWTCRQGGCKEVRRRNNLHHQHQHIHHHQYQPECDNFFWCICSVSVFLELYLFCIYISRTVFILYLYYSMSPWSANIHHPYLLHISPCKTDRGRGGGS